MAKRNAARYPTTTALLTMVWFECTGACTTVLIVLASITSHSTRVEPGFNSRRMADSNNAIWSHYGGNRLYSSA